MIYHAIQIALMVCTDLTSCWTLTRILTFRSKRLFVALYVLQLAIGVAIRELGVPLGIRATAAVLLIYFFLPILMSVDGWRISFVRTLLVNTIIILNELFASTLYTIITQEQMVPTDVGPDTIWSVVLVYAIIIATVLPLFQILVSVCNRIDKTDDMSFQAPIIVLLLTSFLQVGINYVRLNQERSSLAYSVTSLAYCWTTALIAFVILAVALREYRAHKELAQHAITARQVKHERVEIEAVALKAELLYKLRHSLANQMRVIANLAEAGHVDEADMRLAELQKQARTLTGSTNE